MSNEIMKYSEQTFESIKHINEDGQEYWLARELQGVLEYSQWRYLKEAIMRAELACKNSGYPVEEHFADVRKMITLGHGAVIHDAIKRFSSALNANQFVTASMRIQKWGKELFLKNGGILKKIKSR